MVFCTFFSPRAYSPPRFWLLPAAAQRAAGGGCSFFLIRERTNQERGPRDLMSLGTLQREKVAALSLCSSFREVLHLQLLRARLKESRTHGSRTQARKQKDLLSFTAPQFNLISNKNDFVSSPAARGSCIAGNEETAKMFFLFCSLQSGKKREIQEGTSWRVSWTLLAA